MSLEEVKITDLVLDYQGISLPCPIDEGHHMVPVKTVCGIIDVDFKKQDNWLKKHSFFTQLYTLRYTTGADGKQYEMRCLPMFDVISWLASVTDHQRKEGSTKKQYAFMAWLRSEMLSMYKLIEVFQSENRYELELMEKKGNVLDELEEAQMKAKELKNYLKNINEKIEEVRAKRYTGQTALPFPE